MQARQLRRARGSHRSFDRPWPYLPSTDPSYERPYLLRVSSTGPSYERPYLLRAVPYLRQARPMCGVVRCLRVSSTGLGEPTDPSTGPAYERCLALPLMCGDRPGLCAVPGVLTCGAVRCGAVPGVLCFALLTCGALLCFDRARGASTPPGLTSYAGCFALLCPGVLCPALLLACFACFACFALLAYVFSTHTEGGDPGSLHEKKIKTKEF